MVVAAVGGMAAATVCHPLDTLRVQMQVRCEMHAVKALRGAWDACCVMKRHKPNLGRRASQQCSCLPSCARR
jgi:hypothetical protein